MRQSEASRGIYFRGLLLCHKTDIIFRIEEFRTTPSIQQCFKCQGFGHKAPHCAKHQNISCVMKLIPTKTVQTRKKEVQIVGHLMSLAT